MFSAHMVKVSIQKGPYLQCIKVKDYCNKHEFLTAYHSEFKGNQPNIVPIVFSRETYEMFPCPQLIHNIFQLGIILPKIWCFGAEMSP